MKKFITIAITILAIAGVTFGQSYGQEVIKTISLTTTGTTTADATYVVPAGERISILGVYQGVTTAQTNDCDLKIILKGLTSAEAVTKVALANVIATSAIENVGEGDVTADVDPIIGVEGDTFWLDATGGDGTNTVYKLIVKRTKQ